MYPLSSLLCFGLLHGPTPTSVSGSNMKLLGWPEPGPYSSYSAVFSWQSCWIWHRSRARNRVDIHCPEQKMCGPRVGVIYLLSTLELRILNKLNIMSILMVGCSTSKKIEMKRIQYNRKTNLHCCSYVWLGWCNRTRTSPDYQKNNKHMKAQWTERVASYLRFPLCSRNTVHEITRNTQPEKTGSTHAVHADTTGGEGDTGGTHMGGVDCPQGQEAYDGRKKRRGRKEKHDSSPQKTRRKPFISKCSVDIFQKRYAFFLCQQKKKRKNVLLDADLC